MSVPRAAGAPTQLSAAMVLSSPQRLNAVKEYELCLRSLRISRIENLGCTRDQFDTIDFCDNDIVRVEGFPKLCRLKTLLISNNRVTGIGPELASSLPNLEELVLIGNRIERLRELRPLGECKRLRRLTLLQNSVSGEACYRQYVIGLCPALKVLDFKKIKPAEREEAERRFKAGEFEEASRRASSAAAGERGDGADERAGNGVTATKAGGTSNKTLAAAAVRAAIESAKTLDEIQELEESLAMGQHCINTTADAMEEG